MVASSKRPLTDYQRNREDGMRQRARHKQGPTAVALAALPLLFGSDVASAAQTSTPSRAEIRIPDLSGVWTKNRGRLGAVKNTSPFPDMVMGDYTDPILQPWVAAVIKKRAEME